MLVLFVDDDEPVRVTFAALMEVAGLQLVEARSLAEARTLLHRHAYRLAVLDYTLPDGKGTELIAELRALNPSPKIALFTGADLSGGPADAILLKSEAPEMLIAQLVALAGG